jgi:hypothetical protein
VSTQKSKEQTKEDFMEQALQIAAQCWCDPETQDRVMDPALATAFANRLANWMADTAQQMRNIEYYKGLIDSAIDREFTATYQKLMRTADDGSVHDSYLYAKFPEVLRKFTDSIY